MKIDKLYKEVVVSHIEYTGACGKLTNYIIEKVVKDMKDYEFSMFSVSYTEAEGVVLCMEIEKDKKNNINPFYLKYGEGIFVCDLKPILSMYKEEKRKITIKEIFDNRF